MLENFRANVLKLWGPEAAILGADQKERRLWGRECIQRTQLNAAHAQLLEKLRPIAFAETCRFLTIQNFKNFGKKKNSSQTTRMIYREKSEF